MCEENSFENQEFLGINCPVSPDKHIVLVGRFLDMTVDLSKGILSFIRPSDDVDGQVTSKSIL